jgi:hypothetical protein
MRPRIIPILIGIISILFLTSGGSAAPGATALSTAFPYQGSLERDGEPYTGSCDFQFSLWDAETGGSAIGSVENINDLAVTDGLFTAELDFGAGGFIGSARWLEVTVQCPEDAGPTTFPRQQLTAAPYALYATAAPWSGLAGMPSGFADGVDNNLRPALFKITTLDSNGIVGLYTSIVIGADGLGLISYYDYTNSDLKVAHCNDTACSSATTTIIDSNNSVGRFTAITIGADGLGLIAYSYEDDLDLKVAHCNNIACSSATTTIIDSDGYIDGFKSITIGADGLGLISYFDVMFFRLKVAHCTDTVCSSASTKQLDPASNVGEYTSITIGADGLPLISYYDSSNHNLKAAHCIDIACSGSPDMSFLDSGEYDVGQYTSITTGSDGLGLISYYDAYGADLKVAHCNNMACSSATITTRYAIGNSGYTSAITIGRDGLGLISFYNLNDGDLKVIHCNNADCSIAPGATTLDSDDDDDVGMYSSITIGADGLPLISYYDVTNGDLKVAHCSNPLCIPWYRR